MNKSLDELLEMRRKIDEQIRIVRDCEAICGRVKLGVKQYDSPNKPDEWYISIERVLDSPEYNHRMPRISVIRSTDREKCIGYIDEIIKDLQGLKKAIADKGGGV